MINTTDSSVAGEGTGNSCPEVAQNCPLQHSHKIGQRVRIAMFVYGSGRDGENKHNSTKANSNACKNH